MAAAAAVDNMTSHRRINTNVVPPIASSSRSPPLVQDASSSSAFNRLASLGQSIRTATRSKKIPAPEADDFATLTAKTVKGKGKEKAAVDEPKEKTNMFGKLGSKVTFRRTRRESLTSPPPPTVRTQIVGSLRGASISSPALHLSSQALPSPKSRPSVPASSSSGADALASPTRNRRASLQQPGSEISPPAPLLASRRDRHRATKSNPPDLVHTSRDTRPSLDMDSPPDTPTPSPRRGRVTHAPTIRPTAARPTSPLRARSPTQPRVITPTSHRGLVSSSVAHLPPPGSSPTITPPRRSSLDAARRSIDSVRRPSVDAPRHVSGEIPRRTSPVDYRNDSPTPIRRATSPNQKSYAQNRHYNISSASLISPSSPLPSAPYSPENREQLRKAASMLCKEMIRPPPHLSNKSEPWAEVERRMQGLARLERIWGMSSTVGSGSNLNLANSGSGGIGMTSSTIVSPSGEERERRAFCEALRDGFVLCQLMNKLRSGNAVRPDPREEGNKNVTRFLAACASYGLQNEDLFQLEDLTEPTSDSLARVAHTIITLIQFVETPAPSRIKWIKPPQSHHTDSSALSPPSSTSTTAAASPSGNSPTSGSKFNANSRTKSPTAIKSTMTPVPVGKTAATAGPYMKGSFGRASASVPNLATPPLSMSPPSNSPNQLTTSPVRKRYSPPAGLPPLKSDSSEEGHGIAVSTPRMSSKKLGGSAGNGSAVRVRGGVSRSRVEVNDEDVTSSTVEDEVTEEEQDDDVEGKGGTIVEVRRERAGLVPQLLRPPPPPAKSPLRAHTQPVKRNNRVQNVDDGGISAWARGATSPPPSSPKDGIPSSPSRISTTYNRTPTSTSTAASSSAATSSPQPRHISGLGLSRVNSMAAESTRASIGNASFLEPSSPIGVSPSNEYHHYPFRHNYAQHQNQRESVASSAAATDTTAITRVSSILDNTQYGHSPSGAGGSGGGGGGNPASKFGTIRTVTTDLTSDSMMASPAVEGDEEERVKLKDVFGGGNGSDGSGMTAMMKNQGSPPAPPPKVLTRDRERRPSANHAPHSGHAIDLTRVAEEEMDESSSSGGGRRKGRDRERALEREREGDEKGKARAEASLPKPTTDTKIRAVHLHKAKWPDDFVDVFHMQLRNPSPTPSSTGDPEERQQPSPSSSSPSPIPLPSIRTSSPAFRTHHDINNTNSPMSRSISPPRKLAIVGRRAGEESSSLAPRRPSQFSSRHYSATSVDHHHQHHHTASGLSSSPGTTTSALLPKLSRRDASPDSALGGSSSGNGRMMIRRTSNKSPLPALGSPSSSGYPGHRAGSSLSVHARGSNDRERDAAGTPDSDASGGMMASGETIRDLSAREERRGSGGSGGSGSGGAVRGEGRRRETPVPVPFPRAVSGEQSGTPSPRMEVSPISMASSGGGANTSTATNISNASNEKQPRPVRGRFQSELINTSSSRVKARPTSYDELGTRPSRMRFESMVNLGRADSAMASASDLMARDRDRDSMDGSAVRKTLVVKEEGKPPTHFQLGNCIGKGQFGSVYRALNLNTGQMVAVKRIRLEGLKEDEISTLMREVDLVKSLSHPGIVKYEGMARDEDTLSIVLEYAENGSLAHTLRAFGKLNEKLVASYVVKILEGLHYLHRSDVVHCDLKAANILTTKNGNVKLSDFGVSLNLRAMERQSQNDVAGTPNWMAPEVIELKGASTKSDVWSLGCTVVELLTGKPPYSDISNSMTVMFRIVEDDIPPIPEGCSEMLQDFLEQCFQKDPSERPNAEMLCEHPWLKNNWVALQDLRPQDSIPFLRRVSTEIQKSSEMVRYLSKLPDSPTASEFPFLRDAAGSPPPISPSSPVGRRTSNTSIRPVPLDPEHSPGEHSFVKTTFSKPVPCRVCLENVKKAAVLCSKCSLISHSKCAPNAPPTCDFRSQLLLYAHYAEQGNPHSLYANPLYEHPEIPRAPAAMSDVPYIAHHTPRTSVDTPPPPPQSTHHPAPSHASSPPTAFKFMAALGFKHSRSSLTSSDVNLAPNTPASDPDLSNSRSAKDSTAADKPSDLHFDERTPIPRRRPTGVLRKRSKERPRSYTSTSTGLSSLRSAATAAESLNSNGPPEAGRLSQLSNVVNVGNSSSQERNGGAISKEQGRGKKQSVSVKVPAVPPSAVASDQEVNTNDFAELSTSSSILPGSFSWDPSHRRTRTKRNSKDPKQQGNCIVQ